MELTLFPTTYRLDVNGEVASRGYLGEIRDVVAELITRWLAEDPEGLALDAQMLNFAFTSGAVRECLDERGEWYMVVGAQSDHMTMTLKVTKEA